MDNLFSVSFILSLATTCSGVGLDCTKATCAVNDKSIRFFVVGDWGGDNTAPYTTHAELLCANLTRDMSVDKRPQFFVSTGDNFYEYGVRNAEDPRFKSTFEDVFVWGKEAKVPWFLVQGNHDWYGNNTAQIAYTFKSDRWVSPSFSFSASYKAHPDGPSVDMLFIDTVAICGNTWNETGDDADYIPAIGKKGKDTDEYFGPQDKVLADGIWSWLELKLASSKADYLFITGHYPLFSSTHHKTSWCLVPRLQNLMEKYSVTGYFSGHAHNVQYLKSISRINGEFIHHVISGAAHKATANFMPVFSNLTAAENPWRTTSEFFYPLKESEAKSKSGKNLGGLVYADLGAKTGIFEYYKCNGELIYSFKMKSRNFSPVEAT